MRKNFIKSGFGYWLVLLVLLFVCPCILVSQEIPLDQSGSNDSPSSPSPKSSTEPKIMLPPLKQTLLNPSNPWSTLKTLIDDGLKGLSDSEQALNQLENELTKLKAESKEQERLLMESQTLLSSLKRSLEEAQNNVDIAIDRMNDAENYAKHIDELNMQINKDMGKLTKKQTLAPLGFGIAFTGGVVGGTVLGMGIINQRIDFILAGTGTIVGSGTIWVLGHYVLQWW